MSNARYQLLPASDQTPAIEVSLTPVAAGASVMQSSAAQSPTLVLTEINLHDASHREAGSAGSQLAAGPMPPASELPSYNEALRLKKLEANDLPPSYFPVNPDSNDIRLTIDTADLRAINEAAESGNYDQDVGSECMFLSAFMIAFFFNWIGFFASICLLPNAAGKYGALSGFGLSMAKWVTIVRYQEWMNNMNDLQQKMFFWLFIFLGFYLFFRGLINYMSLKYRPRTSAEQSAYLRSRWLGFIE